MLTTTNPLGYQTTYAYNAAGELTSTTDADGRTIAYAYNAAGQETAETWVGGNYTATYQYNADGDISNESDPFSVYSYSYNALGQVTSAASSGPAGTNWPSVTLNYSYDSFGNRIGLTDSLGGHISYTYDLNNNLTGLSLAPNGGAPAAQLALTYDKDNNLSSLTRTDPALTDPIVTSYSYDKANELTNIDTTQPATNVGYQNYTYGYDAAGRLTSFRDAYNNTLSYSYDNAGQLLSAAGSLNSQTYSVSYSYDANGNRTMPGYQTGTDNELLSDGAYNYTYDKDGNTLTQTDIATGTVTYYTWDYRNRLTEVKVVSSGGVAENDEKFTYDVNNNRIGVALNGVQQLYTVYDGANPYIDFDGSGQLTERYLTNPLGLNQFYAQVDANGNTEWLLTDNLGSIRLAINGYGQLADAITYDPFGNIISQTSAFFAPRFLYTGLAYDPITGTYLAVAREENPGDGRWLSQDWLGLGPDSNPYRYVGNDSADATDPSGLANENIILKGIGRVFVEWFPEQGIGEIKIIQNGIELIRFRWSKAAPKVIQTITQHAGRNLPGISAALMKRISLRVTHSLKVMVTRAGGNWARAMIPDAVRAGFPKCPPKISGPGGGGATFGFSTLLTAMFVMDATASTASAAEISWSSIELSYKEIKELGLSFEENERQKILRMEENERQKMERQELVLVLFLDPATRGLLSEQDLKWAAEYYRSFSDILGANNPFKSWGPAR